MEILPSVSFYVFRWLSGSYKVGLCFFFPLLGRLGYWHRVGRYHVIIMAESDALGSVDKSNSNSDNTNEPSLKDIFALMQSMNGRLSKLEEELQYPASGSESEENDATPRAVATDVVDRVSDLITCASASASVCSDLDFSVSVPQQTVNNEEDGDMLDQMVSELVCEDVSGPPVVCQLQKNRNQQILC